MKTILPEDKLEEYCAYKTLTFSPAIEAKVHTHVSRL